MQEEHYMTEEERRAEEERRELEAREVGKEYRKPLGECIQQVRESKGMTQAQLAEVVGGGVTEEEIASYETGEGLMPVPTFVRIATVLGVEPDDLIPKSCLDIPPVTPVGYDSLSVRDRQTVDSVITAFLDQQKYRQAN